MLDARIRRYAQIRFERMPAARESRARLFIRNRRLDDHVAADAPERGRRNTVRIVIRIVIWMQHPVERGDRAVDVRDDREVHGGSLGLADVEHPLLVRHDGVDRQADELDPAALEMALQQRNLAEFRGADRSEVAWVREQQTPALAESRMKIDPAARRFGCEVRCRVAESQAHLALLCSENRKRFSTARGVKSVACR